MIIYKDLFGGNDELASDTYKIKVNIISVYEKKLILNLDHWWSHPRNRRQDDLIRPRQDRRCSFGCQRLRWRWWWWRKFDNIISNEIVYLIFPGLWRRNGLWLQCRPCPSSFRNRLRQERLDCLHQRLHEGNYCYKYYILPNSYVDVNNLCLESFEEARRI